MSTYTDMLGSIQVSPQAEFMQNDLCIRITPDDVKIGAASKLFCN